MKTTSYEISKQLAEAGFEAASGTLKHDPENFSFGTRFRAYDLETILEALPEGISPWDSSWYELVIYKNYFVYQLVSGVGEFECVRQENESLADVAARLLIKLHEKGLINFKKGK